MSNLKPCPLCKGKMIIDYDFESERYGIVHIKAIRLGIYDCQGGTDYIYATDEIAERAWNRRVSDD